MPRLAAFSQPIISQRKIEHEIRLKEGEVSILGGLFERIDSRTLNGWPGLANVPIMRYLFSADNIEHQENEDLIVLIPRIVRMPDWSRENLRALYSGHGNVSGREAGNGCEDAGVQPESDAASSRRRLRVRRKRIRQRRVPRPPRLPRLRRGFRKHKRADRAFALSRLL